MDQAGVTKCDRQSLADGRIIVAGGIPDEHEPRSDRHVDPGIGVGITVAWPGRDGRGEHLLVRKRRQPEGIEETPRAPRAGKAPALSETIAEIEPRPAVALG